MKRQMIPCMILVLWLTGCTVAIVSREEFVIVAPTPTAWTSMPVRTSMSTPMLLPSSTAGPFPTRTPWPNAPNPRSPVGMLACTDSPFIVTFLWSPTTSEHTVVRYFFVVEGAVEESQSWHRIAFDSTVEPSARVTIDCDAATFYRWRVQAQDERGSTGPWSSYAFFQIPVQTPGEMLTTPALTSAPTSGEMPTVPAPTPDQGTGLEPSPAASPPLPALLSLQQVAQLDHESPVSALAFAPDDGRLATADGQGHLRIWNTATWRERPEMPHLHTGGIRILAFSPNGRQVATGSFDHTARLWDAALGEQVTQVAHKYWVYGLAFSPDGRWLATGSLDGTVHLLDLSTGQGTDILDQELQVHHLAFSPDGRWLVMVLTGSWGPGAVQVWDMSSQQITTLAEFDGNASSNAVFSPNGRWLAAGLGGGGPVMVWQTSTWREAARLETVPDVVGKLVFSPDGQWLAGMMSGGEMGNAIWVWQVPGWRVVSQIELEDVAWDVAFSPDGRWLATGLGQGAPYGVAYEAQLWETASGTLLARMAHSSQVLAVAFSHDGRWLATGSGDNTARVWDLRRQ